MPTALAAPERGTRAPSTALEPVSREAILARLVEDERRNRIRRWQRAMAAPYVLGSGTWLYGECAHLAAAMSHQPLTVAMTTAAAAAAGVFVTRFGLQKVYSKRWSLRFWLAAATATAWSTLAAVAGPKWSPGWLLTGALAVSTVGFAGRWWREHRNTTQPPMVESEPVVEVIGPSAAPATGAALIQQRWDRYLGMESKAFPRSILTGEKNLPNGWEFTLILDPDKNNGFDDLMPKRGKIAHVMGVDINDIEIESHPSRDYSRATIKVLIHNPLKDGIPYQGPRYDNGSIRAGMWRDGTGWGSVRVADHKNTVVNGHASGDPGSGKSVFLENLGMSALDSGKWMVFFNDGSPDNDSSPILSNYMTVSMSGIEGAREQLQAVKRYMSGRGKQTASMPEDIRGVNPSEDRLGLLWILDEFQALCRADKDFASEVEGIVRLGRKKGLAIWTATQGLDLNLEFAGNSTLRDILTSRNVVSFYSSSKYAHNLINGPVIAPHTLPADEGGYAYLRSFRSKRAAMMRTDFSDDMSSWARTLKQPSLDNDRIARLAVGRFIEENRQTPEESIEDAKDALAKWEREMMTIGSTKNAGRSSKSVAHSAGSPDVDALIGRMPAVLTSADLRIVKQPSKKDAILAELRTRGTATTGDIAKALGFDLPVVSTTLAREAQKGAVRDLGHGKWGSVTAAVVVA